MRMQMNPSKGLGFQVDLDAVAESVSQAFTRAAHVVWSRIDADTLTARNMPHYKNRLKALSRELFLHHDWDLPDGLRRDGGRSPFNFTLAEWQQAKRLKLDPREIKQSFREAWERSDDMKSFTHALEDRGYFLCRGDRRGFVALDVNGEVFSVPRMIGIKTKEVKARLGDPALLNSVSDTKDSLREKITDQMRDYAEEVDAKHELDVEPLNAKRNEMVTAHRSERAAMHQGQVKRWQSEASERSARLNKGLRGLWDNLTGQANTVR
jgi:hypothetical protein